MKRRPSDDSLEQLISEIHQKLDGAAFNGGFESLVQNVQNIEKTQREMLDKMDDISKVIYEPDEGLFARVKRVEAIHDKELAPLRKDIQDIQDWKASIAGKDGTLTQVTENTQTVKSLSKWKDEVTAKDGPLALAAADHVEVKELSAWKKRIIAFLVAAAGSTLLMVAKTAYEFIKDHVSLH